MRYFTYLFLFFVIQNSYSQQSGDYRYDNFLDDKDLYAGIHLGFSTYGNAALKTGFKDANNEPVLIDVEKGLLNLGLSLGYTIGLKFDIMLGIDIQGSSISSNYKSVDGNFDLIAFCPMLKYFPWTLKKNSMNLGLGLNYITDCTLKINSTLSNQIMIYNYKNSLGPVFLLELKRYFGHVVSSSFVLKYNINHITLDNVTLNDQKIQNNQVEPEIKGFYSNCLFMYVSLDFHLF